MEDEGGGGSAQHLSEAAGVAHFSRVPESKPLG